MEQIIFDYITVNPDVRFGKPVIKGTRVPVDLIVGKLAGGMPIQEIADEYELTLQQIQAALRYAAYLVEEQDLAFV